MDGFDTIDDHALEMLRYRDLTDEERATEDELWEIIDALPCDYD